MGIDYRLGESARGCPARKGIRVIARTILSRPPFAAGCPNSEIEGSERVKGKYPLLHLNSAKQKPQQTPRRRTPRGPTPRNL